MKVEEKSISLIKEMVKKLLGYLSPEGEVKMEDPEEGQESFWVKVYVSEPRILIGKNGANLAAFQHIVRLLAKQAIGEPLPLLLDINDYRVKKNILLKRIAKEIAQKVEATQRLQIMQPMNAYERKIIHTVLKDETAVYTESLGEEPNRRVVIRIKKDTVKIA